jgi:hypothetical protein
MEFHPDKNKGDALTQNKFIMISKSYECFTNEEKKANCFRFGNPDGARSFRVGIGLPDFFIKQEYQFFVLPIVLFILLVWVPCLMIRWNSRTRVLDMNGIAVGSYQTIFKVTQTPIDKFSIPYILASYNELWEHSSYGPISAEDKQKLFEFVKKVPLVEKHVIYELNDSQLHILWEVVLYVSGLKELDDPSFREKVEEYIHKTLRVVMLFTNKDLNGKGFMGNPQWIIKYQGPTAFNAFIEFQRDFYNRTFLVPNANENWLYSLGLTGEEIGQLKEMLRNNTEIVKNLFQMLASATQVKEFCRSVPKGKREAIEEQLSSWPIYDL